MTKLNPEKLQTVQMYMRRGVQELLETLDPNNTHISKDSKIFIKDKVGTLLFHTLELWEELK